jgi:hypothetical protein
LKRALQAVVTAQRTSGVCSSTETARQTHRGAFNIHETTDGAKLAAALAKQVLKLTDRTVGAIAQTRGSSELARGTQIAS